MIGEHPPTAFPAPAWATALALALLGPAPAARPSPPLQLELELRKVASRGDPAPGSSSGLVFEHFGHLPNLGGSLGAPPAIDAQGNVAFHAFLGDGSAATIELGERGVWRLRGGVLELVALVGAPAPGTGTSFTGFPEIFGHTPFVHRGALTIAGSVGGGSRPGVWSDRTGALELVLLKGAPLPGAPPASQISSFAFVARGDVVWANVEYVDSPMPPPDSEGLWRDLGDGLEVVVLRGMQAPGEPPGVVFGEGSLLAFFGPVDRWDGNAGGAAVFNGYLKGPSITELDDEGIWAGEPGALVPIAREGRPVPGQPAGTLWGASTGLRAFGDAVHVPPLLNERGSLLFGADLRGPGFDHATSLWASRGAGLELFGKAFEGLPGNPLGDPAPGLPGFTFVSFTGGWINARDEVAFAAIVASASPLAAEVGLWWDRPGVPVLLAATGHPAPALPGVTIERLLQASLGPRSHLVYHAELSGPGVGPADDAALFLVAPDGSQHLLLREGEAVALGPGDERTISVLNLGQGVTPDGVVPVELFFTDGSVALVTAGPRPGPRRFRDATPR